MLLLVALSKIILAMLLVLLGLEALSVYLHTISSIGKEIETGLLFLFTKVISHLKVTTSHCDLVAPSGVPIVYTLGENEPKNQKHC